MKFLPCSGWEAGNNNPSLVKHIQCALNDREREKEWDLGWNVRGMESLEGTRSAWIRNPTLALKVPLCCHFARVEMKENSLLFFDINTSWNSSPARFYILDLLKTGDWWNVSVKLSHKRLQKLYAYWSSNSVLSYWRPFLLILAGLYSTPCGECVTCEAVAFAEIHVASIHIGCCRCNVCTVRNTGKHPRPPCYRSRFSARKIKLNKANGQNAVYQVLRLIWQLLSDSIHFA